MDCGSFYIDRNCRGSAVYFSTGGGLYTENCCEWIDGTGSSGGSITYTCPNIPPEQIETGDVIAYELKNGIAVLHRVVKKDAEKEIWVTQGDANETEDPAAVSYGQYLGEMVFHVPYAGYVANWLQKKKILFLAVAAAVLLLIVHPTGEERRQIT